MKFEARDFKKLSWQIAIAAGLIVAGGVIAYLSLMSAQRTEATHREAASRHTRIDNKLRQVRTEEEEIRKRTSLFLQMNERGILGEEKRLDWTEMLRDIQHSLHLPGMDYEFSPAKLLDGSGDGRLYASTMKLRLQLVHEEDLLRFLARMQQEAKAMVLVRSCNVARIPPASTSLAQLSADCEIDWITVQIKGGLRTP